MADKPDITLFSTADWDNPFWTNKQHVAQDLARKGYRILYVESVGLRSPTATASDIKRILNRLKKALRLPKRVEGHSRGGIWVVSPLVIPMQRYSIIRKINRYLLNISIFIAQWFLGIKTDWLWTYNPLTLSLLSVSAYKKIIYHCVDAIEQQPGMPKHELLRSERLLAQKASVVFCTSKALYERHREVAESVFYFGNVADSNHFNQALQLNYPVYVELLEIKKIGPILGFVGAISRYKQNFDLLIQLAKYNPEWQIVLIGKVGEGDPLDSASELIQQKNIHLLGPKLYKDLPSIIKGFDVCLLPTQINEYTRNMFPMKFYEYLMAGKDVVSIKIDSLKNLTNLYFPANNSMEFIHQCECVLAGQTKQNINTNKHLEGQTYSARNEKMLKIIDVEQT